MEQDVMVSVFPWLVSPSPVCDHQIYKCKHQLGIIYLELVLRDQDPPVVQVIHKPLAVSLYDYVSLSSGKITMYLVVSYMISCFILFNLITFTYKRDWGRETQSMISFVRLNIFNYLSYKYLHLVEG